MHELSIAQSLVTVVVESLPPGVKVTRVASVRLRLGALSGVVRDALEFCYGVATEGTPLAGSTLCIEDLPVVIYCTPCGAERTLPSAQSFTCPACGTPSPQVRQGREIDVESIELEIDESEATP